jgi:hypothetical protein
MAPHFFGNSFVLPPFLPLLKVYAHHSRGKGGRRQELCGAKKKGCKSSDQKEA